MAINNEMIQVEVVFATAEEQVVIALDVPVNTSIEAVIEQSGILDRFPQINLKSQAVGVFSHLKKLDDVVAAGDRVEIYRPLARDPKELRRLRAQGQQS